jgi:creatinine amidohydrolase
MSAQGGGQYMKRVNIRVVVVLALASTALVARTQTNDVKHPAIDNAQSNPPHHQAENYPTMLNMTFPEFGAATAKTDIALLPIGSIEEHGPNLPLATDSILAVEQLIDVQRYLRIARIETIVGPPLNIGITNEAGDWSRDGTYMYPGSLTVSADTFEKLYVDLLHSLHDNGLRRVFLVSGHSGGRHLKAVARIAEEGNRQIEGMKVYALIDRERAEQLKIKSSSSVILIDRGWTPQNMTELLGRGTEGTPCMHADGCELSLMLHYYPDMVRPGYQKLPEAPPSHFFEAMATGDATKNPSGMGGAPFGKASAEVGKKVADYRTQRIGDAIKLLAESTQHN